ncbi:WD40-repeat-containing domain protein [Chytridium lagenaria]|nr:WD40-repeat-containing domain protein [Chytridium lagenaria]
MEFELVAELKGHADHGISWICVDVLDDAHKRTIRSVAFAPNGKSMASSSFDATTAIWERTGTAYECTATLEGHENEVSALLATCSRDKSVWIWEVVDESDFECLSVLQDHTQDVKMLLASASYDDTIKIWRDDSDDWYCSDTLIGHGSTVWGVDFDASGDRLVSVSDDCSMRIWKRAQEARRQDPKWNCVQQLDNYHKRTIYSVSWSKTNGKIATASGDNTVKIASTNSEKVHLPAAELAQPHGKNDINCVSWCPLPNHSDLFATAGDDSVIRIWRIKEKT